MLISPLMRRKAAKGRGYWITIGGRKGDDGKRRGGSPVYVENGRITRGNPKLTGKRLDAMKEQGEGQSVRTANKMEREYQRAVWSKKARKEGIDPSHLHSLADEFHEHSNANGKDVAGLVRDVIQTHPWVRGIKANARHGIDQHSIKTPAGEMGLDQISQEIANNPKYRHLFGGGDQADDVRGDHSETLFNYIVHGGDGETSHDEAYEEAFNHLLDQKRRHKEESDGAAWNDQFSIGGRGLRKGGLFDEDKVKRDEGGRFSKKDVSRTRSDVTTGKTAPATAKDSFASHISEKPIRRYVEMPSGARIHPDELHRIKHDAAGEHYLSTDEMLTVIDGTGKPRRFRSFAQAVANILPSQRGTVTIQGPHGYSATLTPAEWREVDTQHGFSSWLDSQDESMVNQKRESNQPLTTIGTAKETSDFFSPRHAGQARLFSLGTSPLVRKAGWKEEDHPRGQPGNAGQFGSGGGESSGESKTETPEPQKDTSRKWKKNDDGTYTAPNGTVWRKAAAGGEVSPVTGKMFAGGALMPIHGLAKKKEPKKEKPFRSPLAPPPKVDEDKKPSAPVQPLTSEEIEARKQKEADKQLWHEMNAGPLGKLKWMGDNPNHRAMASETINLAPWIDFADSIGEQGTKKIVEELEPRVHGEIDTWADNVDPKAAEFLSGKPYDEAKKKESAEWEKNQLRDVGSALAYEPRKTQAHHKKNPESLYARNLLQAALGKVRTVADMHKIASLLSSVQSEFRKSFGISPLRKSWDESKHPRDGGKFAETEGGTEGAKESPSVESWASRVSKLPGKVYEAAKTKVKAKFASLEQRYGRKTAIAIVAAGIAAFPLPGGTILGPAPIIAVAELVRKLRGGDHGAKSMTSEELTKLGKAFIAELLRGEKSLGRSPLCRRKSAQDWSRQRGPNGGIFWMNRRTGEKQYTAENPGGDAGQQQDKPADDKIAGYAKQMLDKFGSGAAAKIDEMKAKYANDPAKVATLDKVKAALTPNRGSVPDQFVSGLKSAKISTEQRHQYEANVKSVVGAMPAKVRDYISKTIKEVEFHPSIKSVTAEAIKLAPEGHPQIDRMRAGKSLAAGFFDNETNKIALDGDSRQPGDAKGTYAHEMTHALDFPNNRISSSEEWQQAFDAEIKDGQLTKYATIKPSEAFAEFGRALYASEQSHADLKRRFPKASRIFETNGFWPETETSKSLGSGKIDDIFDEYIDLGNGRHADAVHG